MVPIFADFTNLLIHGQTQLGKSFICKQIVLEADTLFETKPTSVIYCYQNWDSSLDELRAKAKNITFHPSLLPLEELESHCAQNRHTVYICDDVLGNCMSNSEYFTKIFCMYTHHWRMTAILCSQNTFAKGKHSSTLLRNAHAFLLPYSPKDNNAFLSISKQTGNYAFLKNIYLDATGSKPYTYILLNLHPRLPADFRYVTNFLSTDKGPLTIYRPK